jgi:serine phosphatase RsbU (regulator of sigma subunit)
MSYGLAGHPPVLLRRSRDGQVVRLVDADGPVLGPIRDATYTEGHVKLEPGDVLVMYTDGLVERRGRDIETGISQAQRLVADWRSDTVMAQGCRQLTETLALPPRQDDVCVIALRLRPLDSSVPGATRSSS